MTVPAPSYPPSSPLPLRWIDGHLDLAYLAETGRDLTRTTEDLASPSPAAITFPALREGHIEAAVATIFVQPRISGQGPPKDVDGPWCYSTEDEAHLAALQQISHYLQWQREGHMSLATTPTPVPPLSRAASTPPTPNVQRPTPNDAPPPLRILLLLEGASPIRTLNDLHTFHLCGVRIVSLTWADGNKYSGGDYSGGDVTPDGRKLLAAADSLNMIHDVSHLSETAFWTLLHETSRPVIASHSNCRALLPHAARPERHLSDQQLAALFNRRGMLGINLYAPFLVPASGGHPTIADVVRHIQHVVQVAGHDDCLGLGSDMDGGFSAKQLPLGLDHPRKLARLVDALSAAGFSDESIARFAHKNWQRFFSQSLNVVL